MNHFPKIFFFITFLPLTLFSNTDIKDTIFWRSEPEFVKLENLDSMHEGAYILNDNRLVVYGEKVRDLTRHRIVHILTPEGLDDNNKVVIYVPSEGSIINLKARSISPNGSIVELNQDNIKDITNYDENGNLKIFAIEGAEVGGQIEYSYSLRTPLYDSGLESVSMAYPTKQAFFAFCGNGSFHIASKAYNWPAKEHKFADRHSYIFENIPPIEDEKYATPEANTAFVEYKIGSTTYGETIYSKYKHVLKMKYEELTNFNATEKRKINSFLRKFEVDGLSETEKIRRINIFLKSRLYYEDNYSPEYSNVLTVLKKGIGNDFGLTKVYTLVLSEMGIDFKVLMTCDKYSFWFDKDYCSRFYLTEYLIYFPKYETYLYPAMPVAQYGLVPSWLEGNTALIIEGGNTPDFMIISSSSPEKDQTNLKINVTLNLDNNTSMYDIRGFGTGQVAFDHNFEAYYSETEEEKQKSLLGDIEWRYPDCEIENAEMINPSFWGNIEECDDYECKREYKATVKSHSFFEKVGDKLLLNVGKLIGPQNELYSEAMRVQKVSCDHNKSYSFEISITIPEGYKYAGNQNVEIDNVFKDVNGTGENVAGFTSALEVIDDKIIIKIYEYYSWVNIPKYYYEDYRHIINSSADFNKATILLEKE